MNKIVKVALKTHVGHVRQVNEDTAEILRKPSVLLAMVADGMGGHQAGDIASQLAVKCIKQSFEEVDLKQSATEWESWLHETITSTNRYIYDYAGQNPSCQGMGTTIVASLFLEEYYIVAHVGDSRIYRFQKEEEPYLRKLTEDHSLVSELVRSGQITLEQAEVHPHRSWITRALGTEEEVQADVKTMGYLGNENILLCSDGLSDKVSESLMIEILSEETDLDEKAAKLMQAALEAGGDDNITLVLVQPTQGQSELEER